jgi:hypothetical protein
MMLEELLEKIFRRLAPRDLKAAVLVCRGWREAGEAPGLWAALCLAVTAEGLPGLLEMLASRRLQRVGSSHPLLLLPQVRSLALSGCAPSEEQLQALAGRPGLRHLSLAAADLSGVEPATLTAAISGLETFSFSGGSFGHLTDGHVEALLSSPANPRLKAFNLEWNDLSKVEPGELARGVARMKEVVLSSSKKAQFTKHHHLVGTIFTQLDGESRPTKLCIGYNKLY